MSINLNCGVATETEIHFMDSGIRIEPFNVTYKSEKRNIDYCRSEVSSEAAQVISDNGNLPEAVKIYTAGRQLAYLYIQEDSIRINEETSHIEFYDPRKFLDRGVIDKKFGKISLRQAVDWLREEIQQRDETEIITGVELIEGGNADPDEITREIEYYNNSIAAYQEEQDTGFIGPVDFLNFLDAYLNTSEEEGGLNFNQVSLAQCLFDIQDEFEIDSYITDDGILRIGNVNRDANFYTGGDYSEAWSISDYNITIDPTPVSQVHVKGGYTYNMETPSDSTGVGVPENLQSGNKIQWWGYASTDSNNGEVVSMSADGVTDGEQLETRAIRRLNRELSNKVTGNVTVNCITSSPEPGYPQNIKPKDTFGVMPPEEDCHVNIPETTFVVESVTHEIEPDKWDLKVELTHIPQSDIASASFTTSPTSEDFMNSTEFYDKTERYGNS